MTIRVAVLTGDILITFLGRASIRSDLLAVSDTSSGNASYDKSGPTIKEIIQQKDGYQVVQTHCHIVPDDAERILLVVRDICNSDAVDWLISTGGTGFGVRDVTPRGKHGCLHS